VDHHVLLDNNVTCSLSFGLIHNECGGHSVSGHNRWDMSWGYTCTYLFGLKVVNLNYSSCPQELSQECSKEWNRNIVDIWNDYGIFALIPMFAEKALPLIFEHSFNLPHGLYYSSKGDSSLHLLLRIKIYDHTSNLWSLVRWYPLDSANMLNKGVE
jgi:hypothetical protein